MNLTDYEFKFTLFSILKYKFIDWITKMVGSKIYETLCKLHLHSCEGNRKIPTSAIVGVDIAVAEQRVDGPNVPCALLYAIKDLTIYQN